MLDMSAPPDGQERRGLEVNFRIRMGNETKRAGRFAGPTTTNEAETTFKRAGFHWMEISGHRVEISGDPLRR